MEEKTYVTLPVTNLKESLYFYEGILGFAVCKDRPSLSYPGVWYDVGTSQLHLELVQVYSREERCITIHVRGMSAFMKKLDHYEVPYEMEGKSLYIRDPDGHRLMFQCKGK